MTDNLLNTSKNGQWLSSSEQNFSEYESKDVLGSSVEESQQASLDMEWVHYFTETVRYIRQSLVKEDIFKTATEEVRRVIDCHRVVVYSLNEEEQGVVTAESVSPRFSKILGATIVDPCLEAKYIEKYQNGRVKVIPNIYEANLDPCHLQQLERLEIKANLVAPIINEGKLLGLLVANQCSQPRYWREHEIRYFSQIAMQVGFALDNANVLAEVANLRKQADIEAQWTQYFNDTVKLIRQSLNKEDIVKIATEEVRRVLNCDRVVVYSLNQQEQGVVTAESVAPRFTKILGVTIIDPCFETKYIEKYQNGRVKVIPNIYEANLDPCHIQQLERLEIKANLVAPIINEGKLLGLLVANQCSQPRYWREHEIRYFSQIAMQVGFALENAKVSAEANNFKELADTEAEWTQYFTDTVKLIRQSLNREDILKTATEEIRRILDCDRVVVYGLNQVNYGVIIAESVAPRFTKGLGMVMEDPCFEAKYIDKYQNGRVRAIPNIYEANLTPCHLQQLERLEIKANLVAPIINEGKLLGLLVANQCSQFRDWQSYEIRWFSQIAMQVGFALENANLKEANKRANELNKSIFLPQQEDLRQVIIDLSGDSQMIFKAFLNKSLNLLKYLAACRKQIKEILDTAKVIKATGEEVEKQVQRNYNLLEEERENIKSTLESIALLEEAVKYDGIIVKQLDEYCQNISNLITKQINNSENLETQPLLTSEIAKISEIVEIMQARNQQVSTWVKALQTNKQKLDHIVTANIQLARLVGNIIQTATHQAQTFREVEQNMVSAHKTAQNISEKSQFLTNLFAQLSAFARNSTDKIMFWERLKSFMTSFNRLITSIIQKN
ncbi:GAF domain-containing protein [Calothrix sp. CCY 0018]|uniref:GAF domain-containing protein n=1 Tax=Calothrix sp. CCY 0018 TaxID=3103864 RepID=UPI0039C67D68